MIGQAHIDTVTDLVGQADALGLGLFLIEIGPDCVEVEPARVTVEPTHGADSAQLAAALGLEETVDGRLWTGVLHGNVALELWAAS